MKRFHVHVAVDDLEANIRFYSAVFGVAPLIEKEDYAKWMVEDPCVNFAISKRGHVKGVNHLGIQVDSDAELDAARMRLADAAISASAPGEAACCYARSNKYWTTDPQGIAWETYHTLQAVPVFGEDRDVQASKDQAAPCCVPGPAQSAAAPASIAASGKAGACCPQ
jgi:catechol 2,3-dioxygenase-like lactoylglutathione lyase family enzyme